MELPQVGVKEQVLSLKPWLVGKDPLEIDKLYVTMGEGTPQLSGTRTDGSAHNMMRAVSGIEMALWDLAGKVLGNHNHDASGGKFRDKVRVTTIPVRRDMLDKAVCKDWAAKLHAHPAGFTGHKFGIPPTPGDRLARSIQQSSDYKAAGDDPEGIRELPRSLRLGPRHHGALPLGIRSASFDSAGGRGGIHQTPVAGGPR